MRMLPVDADVPGPKSYEDEEQGFAMRRSQALAKDGHYSEATPCTDTRARIAESHASGRKLPIDADGHGPETEYGDNESGCAGSKSSEVVDQGCAMRRSQALAKDDHLNSDERPSSDTLVQVAGTWNRRSPIDADEIVRDPEYGGQKLRARDADSADHSMHHFLAPNDGRGGLTSTVDEDQGSATRRSPALAKEDRVCSDGLWSGV